MLENLTEALCFITHRSYIFFLADLEVRPVRMGKYITAKYSDKWVIL